MRVETKQIKIMQDYDREDLAKRVNEFIAKPGQFVNDIQYQAACGTGTVYHSVMIVYQDLT